MASGALPCLSSMSDQDSGSNLFFADVRRMSEGQINRLSKNQLKSILKEAISEADNVPVPTVDAVRMKVLTFAYSNVICDFHLSNIHFFFFSSSSIIVIAL